MLTQTVLRRFALGAGAGLITIGITAALYASTQNTAGDAPPFSGQGRPMVAMNSPLGGLRMITSRLDLTDPQREQIQGIIQSHSDQFRTLGDRALAAQKALNEAVTADAIDETVIRQRSADLAAVQADIAVASAHAYAEVFQVLTPNQQAQAKALQSSMAQRLEEGRHGRGR